MTDELRAFVVQTRVSRFFGVILATSEEEAEALTIEELREWCPSGYDPADPPIVSRCSAPLDWPGFIFLSYDD